MLLALPLPLALNKSAMPAFSNAVCIALKLFALGVSENWGVKTIPFYHLFRVGHLSESLRFSR